MKRSVWQEWTVYVGTEENRNRNKLKNEERDFGIKFVDVFIEVLMEINNKNSSQISIVTQ